MLSRTTNKLPTEWRTAAKLSHSKVQDALVLEYLQPTTQLEAAKTVCEATERIQRKSQREPESYKEPRGRDASKQHSGLEIIFITHISNCTPLTKLGLGRLGILKCLQYAIL